MKIYHFKPKKEKRGLLYQVFFAVTAIMAILLITFGSYVVTQAIIKLDNPMESPPTEAKVKPAERQRKVDLEHQNRKSAKMQKRITVANVATKNAPDINVSIPAGIGGGMGISTVTPVELKANFNISATPVGLFGVQAKVEKVLICIDTGDYLMSDKKGGLDTYKVIKGEITKLINSLPATTLFNLMAFDMMSGIRINFFQQGLSPASANTKRMAIDWLAPFNIDYQNTGAGRSNYELQHPFLPQPPRSENYNPSRSYIYRIYQAAIEQGADTIFILATDWSDPDWIKKPWTDAETERYRRAMDNYQKQRDNQLKSAGWSDEKQQKYDMAYQKARAIGITKARKWIAEENAKRKAKGMSMYVGTPEQCMREQKFFVQPQPTPPAINVKKPIPEFKTYGKTGVMNYYGKIFKELYLDKKMKIPTLNIIIFRGKDDTWTPEQNKVIRSFTSSHNGGRVKVLRGLEPVKD